MTAINHQNTWHSKETKKDYGPCTPAYYKVHVENGKPIDVQIIPVV